MLSHWRKKSDLDFDSHCHQNVTDPQHWFYFFQQNFSFLVVNKVDLDPILGSPEALIRIQLIYICKDIGSSDPFVAEF